MSCTEFSRQLAEAVERRESTDTLVLREHVSACSGCRTLWLDALLVDRAVSHWKKPVAASGLTERIVSRVAAETTTAASAAAVGSQFAAVRQGVDRAPRLGRRMNRSAGVAILVLALSVCAMILLGRPRPQANVGTPEAVRKATSIAVVDARPIQVAHASAGSQASPAKVGAPVELMVADAGSAYWHLAGNAAKAVTAATVLVPPADAVGEAPPIVKGQEPWVDGMRREIAPVTHQLGHAFEFLIRAVPEKRAPAT
jgi:hypothetical protein